MVFKASSILNANYRPLSPHLFWPARKTNFIIGHYKIQFTSFFSILHRATGVLLIVFFFGFSFLLYFSDFLDSYLDNCDIINYGTARLLPFVICIFVLCVYYHILSGIRHLLFDRGDFLSKTDNTYSAKILVVFVFMFAALTYYFLFSIGVISPNITLNGVISVVRDGFLNFENGYKNTITHYLHNVRTYTVHERDDLLYFNVMDLPIFDLVVPDLPSHVYDCKTQEEYLVIKQWVQDTYGTVPVSSWDPITINFLVFTAKNCLHLSSLFHPITQQDIIVLSDMLVFPYESLLDTYFATKYISSRISFFALFIGVLLTFLVLWVIVSGFRRVNLPNTTAIMTKVQLPVVFFCKTFLSWFYSIFTTRSNSRELLFSKIAGVSHWVFQKSLIVFTIYFLLLVLYCMVVTVGIMESPEVFFTEPDKYLLDQRIDFHTRAHILFYLFNSNFLSDLYTWFEEFDDDMQFYCGNYLFLWFHPNLCTNIAFINNHGFFLPIINVYFYLIEFYSIILSNLASTVTLCFGFFVILYHASVGLQALIKDYIHTPAAKKFILYLVYVSVLVAVLIFIVSVILHGTYSPVNSYLMYCMYIDSVFQLMDTLFLWYLEPAAKTELLNMLHALCLFDYNQMIVHLTNFFTIIDSFVLEHTLKEQQLVGLSPVYIGPIPVERYTFNFFFSMFIILFNILSSIFAIPFVTCISFIHFMLSSVIPFAVQFFIGSFFSATCLPFEFYGIGLMPLYFLVDGYDMLISFIKYGFRLFAALGSFNLGVYATIIQSSVTSFCNIYIPFLRFNNLHYYIGMEADIYVNFLLLSSVIVQIVVLRVYNYILKRQGLFIFQWLLVKCKGLVKYWFFFLLWSFWIHNIISLSVLPIFNISKTWPSFIWPDFTNFYCWYILGIYLFVYFCYKKKIIFF